MSRSNDGIHVEPELNKFLKCFLSVSSILIFTFSITAITIIKKDDFGDTFEVFIGNILLIISYIIALISIGIIAAENYKLKVRKKENSNQNLRLLVATYKKELKTQRARLMINTLILVLGIGDAVYNLTNVAQDFLMLFGNYNAARMMKEDKFKMKNLVLSVSLLENSIKCIYHLSILVFILHHRKYEKMLKCFVIRIFLYSLSFTCLSQWFYVIFQEIRHSNYEKNGSKNAINNITQQHSFNKIEQFLFPLGTEFRISMFIELFPLSLPESNQERSFVKRVQDYFHKIGRNSENNSLRNSKTLRNSTNDRNEGFTKSKKHSMVGHFCMFLSVLISIILVSASIVVIFLQDFKDFKDFKINPVLVSEFCETTFMTTSGIYLIFLLIKIYKFKKNKTNENSIITSKTNLKSEEKTFDFIFLISSQTSLIIYSLLTAVGSIKSLFKTNKSSFEEHKYIIIQLTFVTSLTSIFQSVLQTFCIYALKEKKILHKVFVRILILLNFGIWIFDTFSATKHETSQIQRDIYGKHLWEIICAIFIPLSIFYRLHSSIVLIKLNARAYDLFH